MLGFRGVGSAESLFFARRLILPLFVLVGAVEDGAEATTIQGRPIDHVGILLIVSRVGHDRHDDILSRGKLLCAIVTAHEGGDHWNFRVAEDVAHCVEALAKVKGVDAHGLFSHTALIGVAWRLIVIRERNVGRGGAEHDARMDLAMGRRRICHGLLIVHREIGAI